MFLWFDSGKAWVLFFIFFFPQAVGDAPGTVATAWTIIPGFVIVIIELARDPAAGLAAVVTSAALTVGLSLGMGLFVNKMVDKESAAAGRHLGTNCNAAQTKLAAART